MSKRVLELLLFVLIYNYMEVFVFKKKVASFYSAAANQRSLLNPFLLFKKVLLFTDLFKLTAEVFIY